MVKAPLNSIGSAYGSIQALNDNFGTIEAAFENTLSRDGMGPNQMEANLDMNSNSILNCDKVYASAFVVDGLPLEPGNAVAVATIATFEFDASAGQTSFSIGPYTPLSTALLVEINGLSIPSSLISLSNSTVILPACQASDKVVIRVLTRSVGGIPNAGQIPYTAAGAGAQSRTLAAKVGEVVSVKDFGATGDGVTDDRAAIQNAIDSLGLLGGTVFFPKGNYRVTQSGSNNYCLLITGNVSLLGEGHYTAINPQGVGSTVRTVQIAPSPNVDCSGLSIESLFFGNYSTGQRGGSTAIYIETLVSGANIPRLWLADLFIGEGSSYGFVHINNPVANVNGGVYGWRISNCQIRGGIYTDATGDSVVLENNIITGPNWGIVVNQVVGASQFSILDNNITSVSGAIQVHSARRLNIERNNIEQVATNNGTGAMIDVTGSSNTCGTINISHNLLGAFTSTGITAAVRVRNTVGGHISNNTFLPSWATQYGVDLAASIDIRVGWNNYGSGSNLRALDTAQGTCGVVKNLTLTNGWLDFDAVNFETASFIKGDMGRVELQGHIKSGATVSGTTIIATLPISFRPAKALILPVVGDNGAGVYSQGAVLVETTGNIIYLAGGNTRLSFNGASFQAVAGAVTVSDI